MATLVCILAQNFGWSEHYILWQVSLPRALQYAHAIRRSRGVWTIPADAPVVATVTPESIAHAKSFFDEAPQEEP